MDVWAKFPHDPASYEDPEAQQEIEDLNEWWYGDVQEVVEDKIVPFVDWARGMGIPMVFSNMVDQDWDYEINPLLKWRVYNEPIINRTNDLDVYLKAYNVKTIYYVGFATNNCIIGKPTGIKAMSKLGYDVVLLQDASLSGDYQILTHEQAINAIVNEYHGKLSTTEEVKRNYKYEPDES